MDATGNPYAAGAPLAGGDPACPRRHAVSPGVHRVVAPAGAAHPQGPLPPGGLLGGADAARLLPPAESRALRSLASELGNRGGRSVVRRRASRHRPPRAAADASDGAAARTRRSALASGRARRIPREMSE